MWPERLRIHDVLSNRRYALQLEGPSRPTGTAGVTVSRRPQVAGRPVSILIVDDEPDNREVLEMVLAWESFTTVSAAGGRDALAEIARQAPDLILLDVMMPGMDGFEVATRLKSDPLTARIPIILVTALAQAAARARGLGTGAAEVLFKPLDREVLVDRVKDLLRSVYPDYRDGAEPAA